MFIWSSHSTKFTLLGILYHIICLHDSLTCPSKSVLMNFSEYYNSTKFIVGSGILEYISPLEFMNNNTLVYVFKVPLDRQMHNFPTNLI